MKKIIRYLTLGAFFVLAFTSCQKEPSELILGRWKVDINLSTNHEILTSPDDNFDDTYPLSQSGVDSAFFTFNDNGTVKVESYYEYESAPDVEVLSYTLDDGFLQMENEQERYAITALDSKQLVLDGHDVETFEEGTYEWFVHFVMNKVKE